MINSTNHFVFTKEYDGDLRQESQIRSFVHSFIRSFDR